EGHQGRRRGAGVGVFSWNGISASGELGLLPPPLAGEGWGGGERVHMNFFAGSPRSRRVPPPYPSPASPQAEEGTHRVRGSTMRPEMKMLSSRPESDHRNESQAS